MLTDFKSRKLSIEVPHSYHQGESVWSWLSSSSCKWNTEVTFIKWWQQNCLHVAMIWFSALLPISTPSGIGAPLPLVSSQKVWKVMTCCLKFTCYFMLTQLITIITCTIIIFKLVFIFILAFVKQRVKSGLQNCNGYPGLLMWVQNWLIEQKGQGLYWRSTPYSLIIVYFLVVVLKSKWHPATWTFFEKVATCNTRQGDVPLKLHFW